jgi:hypothetical protein
MKRTICVSQQNIDQGKRGSYTSCPIALAIKEATGEQWVVGFNRLTRVHGPWLRSILPVDVCDKIVHYDQTGDMTPFTFEIDLDEQGETSGNRKETGQGYPPAAGVLE